MSIRKDARAEYRAARDEWMRLCALEDAAFARYFAKVRDGIRTNGAALQRLANRADYASVEVHRAQNLLYKLGIDPHDLDDEDGVERTPL